MFAVAPLRSLLPAQFGGWKLAGSPTLSNDPAQADPVNASLLREYGFSDIALATYASEDGRKLNLKAARFADASGAYGAFTYYKMPQMLKETIGDQGASLNERVIFYRGNVLVDAVFDRLSAMSAAELRDLAGVLPLPEGSNRNLPGLPAYLPHDGYIKNTAKYVVGPAGLEKIAAPLPAQLVDFNAGAEVVLGKFNTSGGDATLMLISYPTPQMAAEHLRRIDEARQQKGQPPDSAAIPNAEPLLDRRTGPMVVIVAGGAQSDANSLLNSVNYEANVTWNQPVAPNKRDNIGSIVFNALLLSGILMGFCLIAGLAFGGARILARWLLPANASPDSSGMEFISLHLGDGPSDSRKPDSNYLN